MLQSQQRKIPFYGHEKTAFFSKIRTKKTARMAGRGVWLFQHKAHSSNLKQVTFVLYILWTEMTDIYANFPTALFATSF
jgi:hypothetical protein